VIGDGLRYQPARQRARAENPSGTPAAFPPLLPERAEGIDYFFECIRNHKPIAGSVPAEVNAGVNEIIDAAIESIRTGRAVSLKPSGRHQ
jgi:predicted dehydrogenase